MSYRTITIPAAVGDKPGIWIEPFPAKVFFCVAASGDFRVGVDGELPSAMVAGRGFGSSTGLKFSQLVFANDGTEEVTVTAWIADKEFASLAGVNSSVVTVEEKESFIYDLAIYPGIAGGLNPPVGVCTIPSLQSRDIYATLQIGAFLYKRIAFQVTNTTEGKDLRLMTIYGGGTSGRVIDLIRGGTTRFFGEQYSGQDWRLLNNSAAEIVCPITMIFDSKPVGLA